MSGIDIPAKDVPVGKLFRTADRELWMKLAYDPSANHVLCKNEDGSYWHCDAHKLVELVPEREYISEQGQ